MALKFEQIPSDTMAVYGCGKTYNPNTIMYRESHILLNDSDIDHLERIELYKYVSFSTLKRILKQGKIFINRVVDSWEDCYENFFLKCNFKCGETEIDPTSFINGVYGMSLTTLPESDAMWRIYSKDKLGVRIKTNAKKLFDTIYIDDECMAKTWFGNVSYKTMDEFKKTISDKIEQTHNAIDVFNNIFPETEFMKRQEFAHESEFRVIVMLDSEQTRTYSQIKRLAFSINPNDFIEEYCLDPRLQDTEYEKQKEELIKIGADKNKIMKSNLYKFMPFSFNVKMNPKNKIWR